MALLIHHEANNRHIDDGKIEIPLYFLCDIIIKEIMTKIPDIKPNSIVKISTEMCQGYVWIFYGNNMFCFVE